MGLNKTEQAEALTHLLKEDYAAYGRLVEDSAGTTREQKIDLLYKALAVADLRVKAVSMDEIQKARDELAYTITSGGAVVLAMRREKAE